MKSAREPIAARCRYLPHLPWPAIVAALAAWLWVTPSVARAAADTLEQAKTLFDSGKYVECVEMSARAVQQYPWYESWRHQKLDATRFGRYAEALASVEKGVETSRRASPAATARDIYLQTTVRKTPCECSRSRCAGSAGPLALQQFG